MNKNIGVFGTQLIFYMIFFSGKIDFILNARNPFSSCINNVSTDIQRFPKKKKSACAPMKTILIVFCLSQYSSNLTLFISTAISFYFFFSLAAQCI